MLDKLAKVQNEILRDGDLSTSSTRARPKVSVQALGGDQVSAQMLINVRPSRFWFDLLTQWNTSGVENIYKFAFGAQEEYLRESLAENKVFIKPFTRDAVLKLIDVKFKGEGFKTNLNLVQRVMFENLKDQQTLKLGTILNVVGQLNGSIQPYTRLCLQVYTVGNERMGSRCQMVPPVEDSAKQLIMGFLVGRQTRLGKIQIRLVLVHPRGKIGSSSVNIYVIE